MTRDKIVARNRANAQKSTGPKTARGKAVVSGNARRHGATARPDPESVAIWLGIILDDPDITPEALIPTDERSFRALFLAKAEAQLVIAKNALRDFEAGMPLILKVGRHLSWRDIVGGWASGEIPRPDMTQTPSQRYQGFLARRREIRSAQRQQKLLKRYLGEATAQRRKAFSAWLLASGGDNLAA
ncbi:hypothetical protein [Pseudosulfitobacter pseudonitzschiae]|uniref:hypothetical protein n=1 Tax=Pseudosulfitobacter pseudonitzschiae TaxID=1402135 RepID=UPI003B8183ED